MFSSPFTVCSTFVACICIAASASPTNYSVQLMEGLAPAGWSPEAWAAAADTMIGKTQAYILTDLIEDLGIRLKVTENSIRESIDAARATLGLKPLPPYEEHGPRAFLNTYSSDELKEEYRTYLPPGWTEEKLKDYSAEEYTELAQDVQTNLQERLRWDLEIMKQNPNPGYFSELPKEIKTNITNAFHEATRQQTHLPPGVRAYKRGVAPLVQVVTLQNYDEFGFFLCRTSFSNQTLWESFFESLDEIFSEHLSPESDFWGTQMDLLEEKFLMPIEDDDSFEGAGASDCRERMNELKELDVIPMGIDVGVVLMADVKAMQSLADPSLENPAHVWAVDVTFDPEKKTYPEKYEGVFEVRTHALIHDLYVALGSGMMTPVEVWELTQKKIPEKEVDGNKHDEL